MRRNRVLVIAEAGVNHNGSLMLAKKLVVAAAKAGADAVKFQTFRTENEISRSAEKADYQKKTTGLSESQFEMVKKLELGDDAHHVLKEYCRKLGIQFLSTPFDLDSLNFLVKDLHVSLIKIPSGEITNPLLMLKAAKFQKPVILSTGMSTIEEIRLALGVFAFGYLNRGGKPSVEAFKKAYRSLDGQRVLKEKLTLLHCTTEYPAPFSEVNLLAMDTMRKVFGLSVGYSDHTVGISVPLAAVARGAVVIEKHLTLDRRMPGPDHRASIEPAEFARMVLSIREVELSLGSDLKNPSPSERKNIPIARKSLVAFKPIKKGEKFTKQNIMPKRPGTGMSPFLYWDMLGRKAVREYNTDDVIQKE